MSDLAWYVPISDLSDEDIDELIDRGFCITSTEDVFGVYQGTIDFWWRKCEGKEYLSENVRVTRDYAMNKVRSF